MVWGWILTTNKPLLLAMGFPNREERQSLWSHHPPQSIEFIIALTHWGRVTHICVGNLTIIGSDNGLSSGWGQAIIWTNAGILLVGPLGTNFSEILIRIHKFSFTKMHLKMTSGKWRPFCLSLNGLNDLFLNDIFSCLFQVSLAANLFLGWSRK